MAMHHMLCSTDAPVQREEEDEAEAGAAEPDGAGATAMAVEEPDAATAEAEPAGGVLQTVMDKLLGEMVTSSQPPVSNVPCSFLFLLL